MREWKRRVWQLAYLAVASSAVGGCASGGGSGAIPRRERSGEADKVLARVINTKEFRMEIRVLTDFHNVLLGSMSAYDTAVFEIPRAIVGSGRQVWLVADPLGPQRSYVSSPVFVHIGDMIQWRIQGVAVRTTGSAAPLLRVPIAGPPVGEPGPAPVLKPPSRAPPRSP
ncbi:MAG: hypothetical protein ACE5HP_11940 [Gemmatimonadota bacterium]